MSASQFLEAYRMGASKIENTENQNQPKFITNLKTLTYKGDRISSPASVKTLLYFLLPKQNQTVQEQRDNSIVNPSVQKQYIDPDNPPFNYLEQYILI